MTKPLLCQKQNKVSQDNARAAVARYARNGACLVCVCVCVCVSLQDTLIAQTLAHYSRLTPKKHASHKHLHTTQFPYPTAILRCFALPTRARKK